MIFEGSIGSSILKFFENLPSKNRYDGIREVGKGGWKEREVGKF